MAGQSVTHPREVVVMARNVVKVKGRALVVVLERRVVVVVEWRVVVVVMLVAVVVIIFLLPRTKKHVYINNIYIYISHGTQNRANCLFASIVLYSWFSHPCGLGIHEGGKKALYEKYILYNYAGPLNI
jgi:hypothetical protein